MGLRTGITVENKQDFIGVVYYYVEIILQVILAKFLIEYQYC